MPDEVIKDDIGQGLGRKTIEGGIIVFTVEIARQIIRLCFIMVLARLLTPKDYGQLGMVMTFSAFLGIFTSLGLSIATVQKESLTQAQLSNLFWVNAGFGAFLAAIMAAGAPAVAWFFKDPELLNVTLWMSLNFLISGAGTQHKALLTRRMEFRIIGTTELIGLIGGGAVGVVMAYNDYGVYALVGQTLMNTFLTYATSCIYAHWTPSLPSRKSGVMEMLMFGGYLTAFSVIYYFVRNLDKVLLGRFWGAVDVGLYTRAYNLMLLPIMFVSWPMRRVLIPTLSRLQNDKDRYYGVYVRAMRILAFISFPIGAGMAVLSDEIIAVVYGSQWLAVIPIFRVLCIAGIMQAWENSMGLLYVSTGRSDKLLRWGLIGGPAIIIGYLPSVWFGSMGAAIGYTVSFIAFVIPVGYWYMARTVGVPLRPLVRVAVGPLVAASLMAALVLTLKLTVLAGQSDLVRLAILVPAGAAAYAAGALVFALPAVKEIVQAGKRMLKK